MKRNLFTLVFLFCCCLFMQGQEIKVEAFSKLERDLTPRTEERLDSVSYTLLTLPTT